MQNVKVGIERPKALSEIAADYIRNAIVSGEFKLGEALTEKALAGLFGFSTTPVREAIATLKREGLLQGVSQKGAYVFTLTEAELSQLCTYRFALETTALDLAAQADPDGLARSLNRICGRMDIARKDGDFEQYLALDRAFHDAFFKASGNPFLDDGYLCVSNKVATLRMYLSRGLRRIDKSFDEHVEITRLIEAGRFEDAKSVLWTQIERGSNAHEELRLLADKPSTGGGI